MLMVCGADKTVFLLKDPLVTGGVTSAKAAHIGHQKQWFLRVQLDDAGTSTLSQATQSMAGSELAMVLDDQVLSAPVIDSSMADGHLVVTGDLDQAQATKLATKLTGS